MKKFYLLGALAMGLFATGCSSDDIQVPEENQVVEQNQTFYVGMKICGDIPVGRASSTSGNPEDNDKDFAVGTGTENVVNNAYFVFYDMNGQVVGNIVPAEMNAKDWITEGTTGTVEKYYRSVVPVSVRKGEMKPIQVICYLNPISPATLQNPLNIIQTVTRQQVFTEVGDETIFAMSNSVYYDDKGEIHIAVPIPNEILYTTEEDANNALEALKQGKEGAENGVITVNVERYASKLSFNCAKAAEPYQAATRIYDIPNRDYSVEAVTLNFVPEYWAVNAESEYSYVIKSFRQESELGQIMADNYKYDVLNSRINAADPSVYNSMTSGTVVSTLSEGGWNWNSPTLMRSYWSISPAYFQAEYPEVAGDLAELGGSISANQHYWTPAELEKNGFAYGEDNIGKSDTQYFRETTVGYKALASNNPAAAVPSVIFVGKYNIKIGEKVVSDPDPDPDKGTSFYTYLAGQVPNTTGLGDRPYIYFDNNPTGPKPLNSIVEGGESMLRRFIAQSTVIFKQDEDGRYSRYSVYDEEALKGLLPYIAVSEIDQKVKEAAADQTEGNDKYKALKLQANARSLQFTTLPPADANIYIATAKGYCRIVADDAENFDVETQVKLSVANATVMQQLGYAYYYNNGEGYFNIPVKHLGWYRAANQLGPNTNDPGSQTTNKFNWSYVRVGDFGMVRNHTYNVEVNKITGLASGISGDNVPIVPPATTDDYFVSYSVRILKWAVVPTQSVDL